MSYPPMTKCPICTLDTNEPHTDLAMCLRALVEHVHALDDRIEELEMENGR